jgi:membrane protease YdiL (CAAX protease family)
MAKEYSKWDPVALGLASGIFFGVYTFLAIILEELGFAGLWFHPRILGMISSIIPGITVGSIKGAVIGLIGAFITGFLACFIYAWLYNKLIGYSASIKKK